MADQNSGGSTDLSSGLGDAFKFGGGITTTEQGSTPPVAESSHQEGVEQNTQPEKAEGLAVETPKLEDEKIFKKQAEDNRKLVIDMLEDKFQQLKNGKLKPDELKQWFSTHGEIAETANRSKRVKDRYRELMDTAVETQKEILPESIDTEEPLTRKELEATLAKFSEEQNIRNFSRSIVQERETQLEDFAIEHKVLDKSFDSLKRNADALFKANPDMDYQDAVKAAYYAFNPQKGSPVNIPTSQIQPPENLQNEKIDATAPGGIQLISAAEFSKGQIK